MAMFSERQDEKYMGGDAATQALSSTVVENAFVERVYEKISGVYDLTFGPTLHPGRLQAFERMIIAEGSSILEVGVGTGINLRHYPRSCQVVGIDLSAGMLEKARERIAKNGLRNVRVQEMDAAALTFADNSFDTVYAPYLISVVPDPVAVVREMRRVCKPGGRIVILNHFKSENAVLSKIETAISPLCVHIGFKSDLDLPRFLEQAELRPISIDKVNLLSMWSLVTCVKDA